MSPSESNKKIPKSTFFSRNMVTIVMIPAIIGIHYGWVLLQDNKALVSEEEKFDLPVITGAKYLWKSMLESFKEKDPTSKKD